MTLGEIIKQYRTEHGLSQDAIADRAQLSKAYISILERNVNPKTGDPPVASLKAINSIATALNSDFDSIFEKLDDNLKISIGEQLPKQPTIKSFTDLPSPEAQKIAKAFDQAKPKEKEIVRLTLSEYIDDQDFQLAAACGFGTFKIPANGSEDDLPEHELLP